MSIIVAVALCIFLFALDMVKTRQARAFTAMSSLTFD
jgi:hypothetical protein